ncbi:MAG TPA: alpha/beta fold hydrolase [Polyangia bacterium]|nr:alpha/beta fold hydrolase [Polyangia bacterium]
MPKSPEPRPAWWARGPHAQTIWGRYGRSTRLVIYERELLPTPDGDDLVIDHLNGPAGAPRVVVLHGLEGSSHAVYVQGLARGLAGAGMSVSVLNFRSCALDPATGKRVPPRRPRLYHSGETRDLDLLVETLAGRDPRAPLCAVGFSLGGNVLLKWLGEQGARSRVEAAATISVPYDLMAASRHLERGFSRVYVSHFLKQLKRKAADVLARFPGETEHINGDRIRFAQTFYAFDDSATAPMNGFKSATDYYRKSSALRFLSDIEVPTLCLNAEDDPFLPREVLRAARDAASEDVKLTTIPWGGHASFAMGSWPWRARYWAEERVVSWLAERPA